MRAQPFGHSSVGPVRVLAIGSAPGPEVEVLDLGATVHRLWVTGGDGVRRNVVLGHATAEEYVDSRDYVGGIVGRYANRIRAGRFPLDGRVVELGTNDRGNTLHGGPEGFDQRVWSVLEHAPDRLVLGLVSPDGDQGFPGTLEARVEYSVEDRADGHGVRVDLRATTDAPTVVNLTSHAYVNLDGDSSGPVAGQRLGVSAPTYLPVDGTGIPGEPAPVAGTPFDLRSPVELGPVIEATGGLDHTYVPDGSGWRVVARLESPATCTAMELSTDQPGLQVYTGGALDGSRRSTTGHPYGPGDGLALEPQLFPDTPNRPDFGSAVLRPGQTYRAALAWHFAAL